MISDGTAALQVPVDLGTYYLNWYSQLPCSWIDATPLANCWRDTAGFLWTVDPHEPAAAPALCWALPSFVTLASPSSQILPNYGGVVSFRFLGPNTEIGNFGRTVPATTRALWRGKMARQRVHIAHEPAR